MEQRERHFILSQGSTTGTSLSAITLQGAVCTGMEGAAVGFLPAELLVPPACGIVSQVLAQAVSQACTISAGSNGIFNSIVQFYDNLNTLDVEAGIPGEQSVPQSVVPSSPGVYPEVNIQLPCPEVDHVTVTPATTSISVGQTAGLNAAAYNNSSPPAILRSSAFTFIWNGSAATGIASVTNSFNVPGGSVAAIQGVSPGGPVTITATEASSAKQGTSSVTVQSGLNVTGLWSGGYTWDQPNGQSVSFGLLSITAGWIDRWRVVLGKFASSLLGRRASTAGRTYSAS